MDYMIRSTRVLSNRDILFMKYLITTNQDIKSKFNDFDEILDEVATNTGNKLRVIYLYTDNSNVLQLYIYQFRL